MIYEGENTLGPQMSLGLANQQLAQSSCGLGLPGDLFGDVAQLGASKLETNSEGWHSYQYFLPPEGVLLQFERRLAGQPSSSWDRWVGYAYWIGYFVSEFRMAGLYWRLTGIGKHQIAGETWAR